MSDRGTCRKIRNALLGFALGCVSLFAWPFAVAVFMWRETDDDFDKEDAA